MENNIENKRKFFAQYLGQNVNRYKPTYGSWKTHNVGYTCSGQLYLKPLSLISDEDAIEVSRIMYNGGVYKHSIYWQSEDEIVVCVEDKNYIDYVEIKYNGDVVFQIQSDCKKYVLRILNAYDFLRSKGYALPFMELDVQKLIEYGWLKLRSDAK